jgi:hypothetical protein
MSLSTGVHFASVGDDARNEVERKTYMPEMDECTLRQHADALPKRELKPPTAQNFRKATQANPTVAFNYLNCC